MIFFTFCSSFLLIQTIAITRYKENQNVNFLKSSLSVEYAMALTYSPSFTSSNNTLGLPSKNKLINRVYKNIYTLAAAPPASRGSIFDRIWKGKNSLKPPQDL